MGFFDTLSDLVDAAVPWSNAHAEAAPESKEDSEVRSALCFCYERRMGS